MKTIHFHMTGNSPLIMHADTLVDPFHPLAKEKKKITGKKGNKTEDDLHRIDEIEFIASLYIEKDLGPVVPAANIERMMIDAAKRTKAGVKAKMGLQASDDLFPLVYDGPRTLDGLLGAPKFHFRKSVKQGMTRIMRVRPWFHDWALDVGIAYDEKIFDPDDVRAIMVTAGRDIGLGDWRPRYGRFDVKAK